METFLANFDNPQFLIKAVFLSLPIFLILIWKMFPGNGSFLEALRYLYQPGWLSVLRGETGDDFWEKMKLYLAFALWAGMIAVIYKFLQSHV